MLTLRRCALLGFIFGAHLLLFSLITLSDKRREDRKSEEALITLFQIDFQEPDDPQPSTASSARRPGSTYDPSRESRAVRDNTITLPPGIEGPDAYIDWDAEATRVARDAARSMGEEKKLRSLDQAPVGMGPPPKVSGDKSGVSEHFEGGVIIDWISNKCYYSNQDEHIDAFGPALRLKLPTCTGRGGGGGEPLPSIEQWKKERDSR
jgi:hypothetical protein